MKTITTHDAKTHLSRYLAATERGEEFLIARGKRPVACLVPLSQLGARRNGEQFCNSSGAVRR